MSGSMVALGGGWIYMGEVGDMLGVPSNIVGAPINFLNGQNFP